ncbi:hypothetical protein H2203_002243 [Taxawa tesnikishii (nom. ined.)]|nr:hypothetical protein H2203_002243 [Dothideales sp. JES 119]
MPSAHPFVPVWQRAEAQQTFRTKKYAGKKRKRSHRDDSEEEEEEEAYDSDDRDASPQPDLLTSATPARPPAANLTGEELKDQHYDVQRELAEIKPPLYVPSPAPEDENQSTSLRRDHLDVLTTIMHTALLRGDYVRAGRAWGLILRTDFGGRGIDVRAHGRWGIGAEILLRRDSSHAHRLRDAEGSEAEEESGDADVGIKGKDEISSEGFALAKEYYERLILQYPYQKTYPHAINALTFYPAMFGLEIYEAQQRSQRAVGRMETSSVADQDNSYNDAADDSEGREEQTAAVKKLELDAALSLAGRMDELLISPPFDKYVPLLQLRGMVALWIADLYEDTIPRTRQRGSADESEEEEQEDPFTRNQRLQNTVNARSAREKATGYFRKVKDGGGQLPAFVAAMVG